MLAAMFIARSTGDARGGQVSKALARSSLLLSEVAEAVGLRLKAEYGEHRDHQPAMRWRGNEFPLTFTVNALRISSAASAVI